jgi:tRNA (guanine37-N1)-methyltransferase
MVIKAEPILRAWEKAVGRKVRARSALGKKLKTENFKLKTIILSPRGKTFDQAYAKKLAKNHTDIVLISGRYEGIDARVKKILKTEEVSVGDYVLTGGELPALTIIDAVARNIPGVLGTFESLEDERISSGEMYTRPETFEYRKKKYGVPPVFLSGNHSVIEKRRSK